MQLAIPFLRGGFWDSGRFWDRLGIGTVGIGTVYVTMYARYFRF